MDKTIKIPKYPPNFELSVVNAVGSTDFSKRIGFRSAYCNFPDRLGPKENQLEDWQSVQLNIKQLNFMSGTETLFVILKT